MSSVLSYEYNFYNDIEKVYDVIEKEQLKFFQQYKPSIQELKRGTSINKELLTKTGQKPVNVKLKINEIIKNRKIELATIYNQGSILQTYTLSIEDGITKVVYSEDNQFEKKQYVLNYKMVGFFYSFFYKRKMKKRMEYIESIVGNNLNDIDEENTSDGDN